MTDPAPSKDDLLRNRRHAERSFNRQYDIIIKLLSDDTVSSIDDELKLLNADFFDIKDAHRQIQLLCSDTEHNTNAEWYDAISTRLCVLKEDCQLWKQHMREKSDAKHQPTSAVQSNVVRPGESSVIPAQSLCTLLERQESLLEKQGTLLQQQGAPEIEIDKFNGNPLEYKYFMATFMEAVDNKVPTDRGRLIRLNQHLEGEPKELVRHCIQEPPTRQAINALYNF